MLSRLEKYAEATARRGCPLTGLVGWGDGTPVESEYGGVFVLDGVDFKGI